MTEQNHKEPCAENPHKGRRARRREQFLEHGLDSFADHEVLELLLYYALPRKDTNLLAHRLLDHFGSLDCVLSAPLDELEKVDGVGENAATLLVLILPLVRRAQLSAHMNERAFVKTEDVGRYFCELFFGAQREEFYELCLDAKGKLLRCFKLAAGAEDTVRVDLRAVVQNALHCHASGVVLSHNHPSGVALPSPDDNNTTLAAYDALRTVGVQLLDHIIVADDDFVSLRENGLFG